MKTLCEYNFMLFDKDNNRLFHIEPHYKSNGKSDGASFLALNDLAPNLKTMPFVNTSIQRFSVEDTLLLTCLHHGMKEGWTLLKYLFDVYAILKKEEKTINWVYIFQKAAQLDIKTTFLISLSLLTRLFNMTFADNVLLKIQDKKVQNLTENRLKNLNNLMVKPNPVSTFLFNLQCMEAWSSRLKVLYYRIIYPHPTDIQFLSLPPYLFFLYFFIRPMRGLIKLLAFYH